MSVPFSQPAPQPPFPAPGPKNGLGTASMVLGIVGAALAFIPIIGLLAWPTVIVGLVLGIVGLTRARAGVATNKSQAVAGVALSSVGLVVCIGWVVLFGALAPGAPVPAGSQTGAAGGTGGTGGVAVSEPQYPSREHENALESAESYLRSGDFSEAGLRGQLKFEQYPPDVAAWAVDNVHADWNAEALSAARSYSSWGSFSDAELHDQLTSEVADQFTPEQADYAIANLGR